MSVYSTGVVRVIPGSAILRFTSADIQTNCAVGQKFKLKDESTSYTIAAIYSATKATLNSRYANSNWYIGIGAEHVATSNSATNIYSDAIVHTPIIQTKFVVNVATERFADDGAGVLTSQQGGSGTIGYDDGSLYLILGQSKDASNITASYFYGRPRVGLSYQILKTRTANYNIPKVSINDGNQAYITSAALDTIDSVIASNISHNRTASCNVATRLSTGDFGKTIVCNATTIVYTPPGLTAKDKGGYFNIIKRGIGSVTINATANQYIGQSSKGGTLVNSATTVGANVYIECISTNFWYFRAQPQTSWLTT